MNIRKNIIYFLSLFALIFSLISCDNSSDDCNHTYTDVYTYDSNYHYMTCINCNEEVSEEHSFTSWTVVKEATYKAEGKRTRNCSVCGYTEEQQISKIAHSETYDDYSLQLDENDDTKVTLIKECIYCGKKEEIEYILNDECYMLFNLFDTSSFTINVNNITISYDDYNYQITDATINVVFKYDDNLTIDGDYTDSSISLDFTIDNEYLYIGDNKKTLDEVMVSDGTNNYTLEDLYTLINDNYNYYFNEFKLDLITNQDNISTIFNKLFTKNESTYTLIYDYIKELDIYLKNTTVKDAVDSCYKTGTYSAIKLLLPGIQSYTFLTIISKFEEYGIDIDDVINILDSAMSLATNENKYVTNQITSYLNINLNNMTLKEYFLQDDIKNLTINEYLLQLGYSQNDINEIVNKIQKYLTNIQDLKIYEAIWKCSNYDGTYDEFISYINNYINSTLEGLDVSIQLDNLNKLSYIELKYNQELNSCNIKIYPKDNK